MKAHQPEDVDRLFEVFVNASDLDGLHGLYEPGATLVMPDADYTGSEALRKFLGEFLEAKPQLKLNVVKVVRVGEELAFLYNEWSGSMTGAEGQSIPTGGKAIEVVRLQTDGTWKFVFDDPWARG
jgi:ketosteroid isomerase-like protein